MSSLQDCIEACALYTWHAYSLTYNSTGCTGAGWSNGRGGQLNDGLTDVCVLKANINMENYNNSNGVPGYDGAVLVFE